MIEPLFSPTMWNAMASPPQVWPQAAMPLGGQVPAAGVPVSTASQIRVSPDVLSYGAAAVPAPPGPANVSFGYSTYGAPELVAPTSALVATVANRRGQPAGPTTDAEIEDVLNDTLDLIPGTSDVEVRCESGRAILSGSVAHKRHKRDIGEVAWAIPAVNDVQNNLTIVARRRGRGLSSAREADVQSGPARKHA